MSSTVYTVPEAAGVLGMSTSQVYAELLSFPHKREGAEISFTWDDVAAIREIRAAGPEEQLKRYQLLADKKAAVQALDSE